MAIRFYKVNDEYGCFSNFSRHGFELDGKYWMTSEHYFQAKKFIGIEYEEQVRMSSTPMEAANMGRDRSKPLKTTIGDAVKMGQEKICWERY